jgi:hypothetical protein
VAPPGTEYALHNREMWNQRSDEYQAADLDRARRWPVEHIWRVRRAIGV